MRTLEFRTEGVLEVGPIKPDADPFLECTDVADLRVIMTLEEADKFLTDLLSTAMKLRNKDEFLYFTIRGKGRGVLK